MAEYKDILPGEENISLAEIYPPLEDAKAQRKDDTQNICHKNPQEAAKKEIYFIVSFYGFLWLKKINFFISQSRSRHLRDSGQALRHAQGMVMLMPCLCHAQAMLRAA